VFLAKSDVTGAQKSYDVKGNDVNVVTSCSDPLQLGLTSNLVHNDVRMGKTFEPLRTTDRRSFIWDSNEKFIHERTQADGGDVTNNVNAAL